MNRFLYFAEGTTEADVLCVPVSQVIGIDIDANDSLNLYFNDLGSADTNQGIVVLRVTAGKTKEVSEAICKAMSHSTDPFIVVADDVNTEYIHPDLTSCGAIQEQA